MKNPLLSQECTDVNNNECYRQVVSILSFIISSPAAHAALFQFLYENTEGSQDNRCHDYKIKAWNAILATPAGWTLEQIYHLLEKSSKIKADSWINESKSDQTSLDVIDWVMRVHINVIYCMQCYPVHFSIEKMFEVRKVALFWMPMLVSHQRRELMFSADFRQEMPLKKNFIITLLVLHEWIIFPAARKIEKIHGVTPDVYIARFDNTKALPRGNNKKANLAESMKSKDESVSDFHESIKPEFKYLPESLSDNASESCGMICNIS